MAQQRRAWHNLRGAVMAAPANTGTVAMTLEKAAEGRRRVAPESDEGGSPKRSAPTMSLEKRAASWSASAQWNCSRYSTGPVLALAAWPREPRCAKVNLNCYRGGANQCLRKVIPKNNRPDLRAVVRRTGNPRQDHFLRMAG